MKKFLITLGVLFLSIGFVLAAILFYGNSKADELEQQQPLEPLVQDVLNSPDFVPLEAISPYLQQATLAVEDARYYQHTGISALALIRAAASQILPFLDPSGGSTISQQVVKNLYQRFNANWQWKVEEISLSIKLEEHYSKDQILALYFNIINYGDNYIGISQASRGYFNLEPSQLDLAQASLLAGIPQSPSNFQLSNHAEAAKSKQETVLKAMVRNGYLDETQVEEIYLQPIDYYDAAAGIWTRIEGRELAI